MKLPTQIVALTFSLVELARAWSIGWMNPKEDIVLLKQAGPTVMSMGPGGHKQAADVKMLLYEALGRQIKALHAKEKALHVKEVLSDRPEMEKLLKQRIGLTPDPVSDHFALACFHDRIGRDADALAEWKIASHPQVRVYASILSDPAVLSHYGDISLRLGDRVFAYEMYESAGCPVLRSNDFGDLDIPSDPIETMKHAAHYHAAEEKITHGDLAGALEDFKMALPLLHCSVNGRSS